MNDLYIEILGVAAGTLSATSFVPQIVKIFRERDTSAISLRMFVITVIGFAMWTTYGILTGRFAVIVSNLVALGLSATILVAKLRLR